MNTSLLSPAVQPTPASAAYAPGEWPNMPAEEYHALEAMSASGAKKMLRSPQHYRLARDTPMEPTDAMRFGTAVHLGVLEPERFDTDVTVAPEINRRTKDGKAEWAAFQALCEGKIILDAEDMERAEQCIDAVNAHPAAMRLLRGARFETSLLWQDAHYDVPCKARFDAFNHGGVIDLKTCQDASPDGFARQCASLLYHLQAAFYWSAAEHVYAASPRFFAFIAVESEPPHAVACYTVPPAAIQAGMRLADEALASYRDALAAGRWPGYAQTITELALPKYALRFDA